MTKTISNPLLWEPILHRLGYLSLLVQDKDEQFYKDAIAVYKKVDINEAKYVLVTLYEKRILAETYFYNSQGAITNSVMYQLRPGENLESVLHIMEGLDSEY